MLAICWNTGHITATVENDPQKVFRLGTLAKEMERNLLRYLTFWITKFIPCMQSVVPEIEIVYN
jgi:hypothetical protein